MSAPELPPHILASDGVDEEAEQVVSALAQIFGQPRWTITDDRTAEWVMAKLAAATAEISATAIMADEWRARIDQWEADETRRARATSEWAEAHLTRWLEQLHAADEKVKSRKLPSGKVTSTAGRLEWIVADEEAVKRWAVDNDHDELVTTQLVGVQKLAQILQPNEAAGVAGLAESGEVVPGIVIRRKPRTYKATPG